MVNAVGGLPAAHPARRTELRPSTVGGTLPAVRAPHRVAVVAVVLCTVALAGCTDTDGDPSEDATDGPSSVSTAENDSAAPDAPASFGVRVEHIQIEPMDNARILGAAGTSVDNEAVKRGVAGAREALAAFLNAQFVDEDTRFSAAPVDRLLSASARAAISAEHRAGLGDTAVSVDATKPGSATATAHVLVHGNSVHAVSLAYTALLEVTGADGGDGQAKHTGTMTFLPTAEGWRAEAADVTLELP